MMKIEQSAQTLNPFGGINFVVNTLRENHIAHFLDTELGNRPAQAHYSYSDVLICFWLLQFCGGECAEDINQHFKKYLQAIPGLRVPSGDTVLEVFKSLKTPTQTFESKHGVTHQFNIHQDLNRTLIRLHKKTGLLCEGTEYTYDYDNQVIATEKYDAKRSYKQSKGYQPGVATIAEQIVYIENRNGNSQAKYLQHETLERSYKLLEEAGITIGRSRMDSASFQKEVIEVVKKYSKTFYIRAMRCDHMEAMMHQVGEWKTVTINFQKWEVASVNYAPFGGDQTYRLVISRQPRTDKQGSLLTGDHYLYRGILTDDYQMSDEEVIRFYNQRGCQEKVFDVMNNDFGWAKLPFSFINENTVFMLITAMCKSIYTWLVKLYSEKVHFVEAKGRLKKFIFHFITVCSKWVKRGRQYVLRLFTEKDYTPLTT
jgi:hypothetical protein